MAVKEQVKKKGNIITIDLSVWCTQQQKAIDTGIRLNTISQQIKRTKEGKTQNPIEFMEIPELNNLILVKK